MINKTEKRFFLVDLLRAFSALIVLNSHIDEYFQSHFFKKVTDTTNLIFIKPLWNLTGAHPGVIIFIVLSGFLIHNTNKNKQTTQFNLSYWKSYLQKRTIRIFPVLILAILLGLSSVYIISGQLPEMKAIFSAFVESFYANGITMRGNDILNTVITEYWIYILIYPLFILSNRSKWVLLVSFLLYMVNYAQIFFVPMNYAYSSWMGRNFYTFQFLWLMGAWFSQNDSQVSAAIKKYRLAGLINIGFVIFLLAGNVFAFKGKYILTTPLFAAFLAYAVAIWESTKGVLIKIVRFFSDRVFTIYAIHLPIIVLFAHFAKPGNPILSDLLLVLLLFCCIEVVYRLIEKPSHTWARRIPARSSTDLQ